MDSNPDVVVLRVTILYPKNDRDLRKRQQEKDRIREEILAPEVVARRRQVLEIELQMENQSTSLGLRKDLDYAGRRPDPFRKVEYDKLGFPLSPPPDSIKKIPDPNYPPCPGINLPRPGPLRFYTELFKPEKTTPCLYCLKVGHSPSACSYQIQTCPEDCTCWPRRCITL